MKKLIRKSMDMKKSVLTLFVALVTLFATAQKEEPQEMKTLFSSDSNIEHGAYGAITIEYAQIDNRDGLLIGGRGAWIINHGIALGLGGKGIAAVESYKDPGGLYEKYYLNGGYGGLLIEPIIAPMSTVHVSFPVIIGAGGVAFTEKREYGSSWEHTEWYTIDAAPFFVAEPGVEINVNLVKFMRLSFGGYYRYTAGLELNKPNTSTNVDKDILNGFSVGMSLKFGKF